MSTPFFRRGLGTYASEITPCLATLGLEPTGISRNRGDDPVRECPDGIEVHRLVLFNACNLYDLLAESGLPAFLPAWKENLCETLIHDVLAATTATSGLAGSHGSTQPNGSSPSFAMRPGIIEPRRNRIGGCRYRYHFNNCQPVELETWT